MDTPEDRHRFTRRLEAFSDIVFGFALAQSAVALEVPKNAGDVAGHLTELIYFGGTFILIFMFWMMHYRIFHYVFAARTVDVLLNFLLLGIIAMLPYALRVYIRFPESALGGAAYALALGVGFTLITALEVRGLGGLSGVVRARWDGIAMRHGIVAAVFLFSLVLFPFFGTYARIAWGLTAPGMWIASRYARSRLAAAGTAGSPGES